MTLHDLWWGVFLLSLAGNIYGWAITLLRALQNSDGIFAKVCLVSQFLLPIGFRLAFIFGWSYGTADNHRRVMIIWSISVLVLATLGLWEPH